jgi:hypothetical protein
MQNTVNEHKSRKVQENSIKFSGTPSNLEVTFLKGKFSGSTFKLTGEMIEEGKFWAYPKSSFFIILPEERKLSEDERAQVIAEIKKFSDRIEFE